MSILNLDDPEDILIAVEDEIDVLDPTPSDQTTIEPEETPTEN